MQEHQVTVARNRYPLDPPFFVLATQNPLEMEGTYPLPEAQLDRFLFKVMVPFPSEEDLIAIIDRTTGAEAPTAGKVATAAEIVEMQRLARAVPDRARTSPPTPSASSRRRTPTRRARPALVREYVRYGGSPRGAQALVTAGKIYALLDGRFNVSIDDIRAAALPALRHRVILNFEGEAEGITTEADRCARSSTPSPRPRSNRRAARDGPACPRPRDDAAAAAPAAAGDAGGGKPAFLPSELDPTVFDEGFLRQLERLQLLMKQPVRGGLKGGRRSVKRGQSVEFADFRDYTLGDDLRQLDWNVYARLEKLFVKLFVEEEDVTITFLLDASPSMADGRPDKLQFAKRAAAALGYIGLASRGPGRRQRRSAGRAARRQVALRGSGRVFRLLSALSAIQPAEGPTDLAAAARHAAAMLSGRGVVVLLSDLLDPAADRVIRELAATGSELIVLQRLSPDELDPQLEGDLRLVDSETGDGIDVTVDLATIDQYKARLAAWQESFADLCAKRRASYVPMSTDLPLADLVFAELRRRRVVG